MHSKPLRRLGLVVGPLLFLLIGFVLPTLDPAHPGASRMTACTVLVVVFWITEALPVGATSLLPVILFPLLGLSDAKTVSLAYMNPTLLLFIGGFLMSLAMEEWNLHRRIALNTIELFGGHPAFLTLGFFCATALISMWISNTATTLMMMPVGLALLTNLEKELGEIAKPFGKGLLIGIAWSSSIGGVATPIGTPPNLIFVQLFRKIFPDDPAIGFSHWMKIGVPLMTFLLIVAWLLLTQVFFRSPAHINFRTKAVRDAHKQLGRMAYEEKIVMGVFSLLVFLWTFRLDFDLGALVIPGWGRLLAFPKLLDDGTVALLCALILFAWPTKNRRKLGQHRILEENAFMRLPWDIILLFGGGFALADGFESSGLSTLVGEKFAQLGALSMGPLLVILALSVTFLSELASNVSIVQLFLPIVGAFAHGTGQPSLPLMFTTTLAASMGFMFPMATAPNAIVYSSKKFTMGEMVRAGLALDVISGLAIAAAVRWIGI